MTTKLRKLMSLPPLAALVLVIIGLSAAVAFTIINTDPGKPSPQSQRYHQKLSCEQQSLQFYQRCMEPK